MEKNFYPDNFEKYIKSHADQFRMTPSKKVWHGLYNDLHPGRRWPSITMSLVFIFALVIIGHLNSNNQYQSSSTLNKLSALNKISTEKTNSLSSTTEENKTSNTGNLNKNIAAADVIKPASNFKGNYSAADAQVKIFSTGKSNDIEDKSSTNITTNPADASLNSSLEDDQENLLLQNAAPVNHQIENIAPLLNNGKGKENTVEKLLSTQSFTVAKIAKVRKNPAVFNYFVTPSFGYRSLSDKSINNAVTHKIKIGYEAGISMNTRLVNQLRFTSGVQLDYSGYHIKANSTHPTVATLYLNSEIPGLANTYSAMSRYSNGSGNDQVTLKNYNFQISSPIGLQYLSKRDDNIEFVTEATLQPSYTFASNAYMLSSDAKNYVTNPDIYRKVNMSTSLSTSVAFKSSAFKWQIGPQFRYQLLSSYLNNYPVKEHLINYGIRLGISKISK